MTEYRVVDTRRTLTGKLKYKVVCRCCGNTKEMFYEDLVELVDVKGATIIGMYKDHKGYWTFPTI